ncbi:uncharacterized protein [Lepeophtheirus salmonis]|uniref:uncharacterized protein n=1 Tax=Lepeophtheirus salmonis TaxID=72036 RepID=UPI001AE91F29|nr:uncharacterized protein LOC121122158 isoform X1 [Lepeophtheirus salmonis]XP_040573097.1 uncharacterized protein LOC121122158 isoform X1 [Lepeophtheirus salmonis]XP_040573098.1 uncharacterized protein LOC121122158 isoform X1 [Lepeophtheirus salmonis]XP_040573099.1 uncharacterized protein LOC121122158 isoform X1 [Lepeophtheirus salmonis]XP_040573100.1 uncharacterized protein LOC121122158 isoform X1 [Lepeophtheirus salmonis]
MSSVELLSDSLSHFLEKDEKSEESLLQNEEETRDEDSDGGDSWIVVEGYSDEDDNNKDNTTEVAEISEPILLGDKITISSICSSEDEVLVEDESGKIHEFKHIKPIKELTTQCSRIKKGVNYSHKPNRELNVFLTASVVLGLAVVLGFGCGHFLGWSEKLEILDMNQTDASQPSDESVDEELLMIERLKSENEELRTSINEANLLRNQIQNLENEIEKLRLNRELITENLASQKSIDELRVMLDQTNSLLRETKENLNDITNENEILKIEVGKARYGKPVIPIEEKEKINKLMTENEELKEKVKKVRYNIPSSSDGYPSDDCTHSTDSCKSEETPEYYFDHKSEYINYAKEFMKESTDKIRNVLGDAHSKFIPSVIPVLNVITPGLSSTAQYLGQKFNIKEKLKETMDAFAIDEAFNEFLLYIKYGEGENLDEESQRMNDGEGDNLDEESQRMNDGKGEDLDEESQMMNDEKNGRKEENSWYLQRGKNREFNRKNNLPKNNWLFQRASSRKQIRKNKYDTSNHEQFNRK